MTYTDQQYLDGINELFGDDGDEVRCYQKQIVKTRKEHPCMNLDTAHPIPVGSRAVRESAIVDGSRCSSYTCLPCIEKWLRQIDFTLEA
jgi:hypothetical protein